MQATEADCFSPECKGDLSEGLWEPAESIQDAERLGLESSQKARKDAGTGAEA